MVSHSQTVEDGGPRRPIEWELIHEGMPDEYIRVEMVIRRPYSLCDFSKRLVIRASRQTGRVVAQLWSEGE